MPIAQRERRLRFADDLAEFFGAQQRHARHCNQTCFHDREPTQRHAHRIRPAQQHAVAGNELAIFNEIRSDAVDDLLRLAVSEVALYGTQHRVVSKAFAAHRMIQQMLHRIELLGELQLWAIKTVFGPVREWRQLIADKGIKLCSLHSSHLLYLLHRVG